mmetsp:Transcript_36426/g.88200  ORF Transcript_36426/g.88200 Transcript_36426/m.88200 type:complete len:283 (+) Transcript_36426:298-1146(+)
MCATIQLTDSSSSVEKHANVCNSSNFVPFFEWYKTENGCEPSSSLAIFDDCAYACKNFIPIQDKEDKDDEEATAATIATTQSTDSSQDKDEETTVATIATNESSDSPRTVIQEKQDKDDETTVATIATTQSTDSSGVQDDDSSEMLANNTTIALLPSTTELQETKPKVVDSSDPAPSLAGTQQQVVTSSKSLEEILAEAEEAERIMEQLLAEDDAKRAAIEFNTSMNKLAALTADLSTPGSEMEIDYDEMEIDLPEIDWMEVDLDDEMEIDLPEIVWMEVDP